MANILDYLLWRDDLSLQAVPFNDVDNLILSQFTYIKPDKVLGPDDEMTVREIAAALKDAKGVFGFIGEDNNREMLRLMGESSRFGDLPVTFYRHETDIALSKQFAAMTFLLPDNTAFVAYRGTDNTMVGWKEDFTMAVACPVPAQADALKYLKDAAERFALPLYVGGHSKGGNLAVYAASFAGDDLQDRLLRVYSHDGPGMTDTTAKSDGYKRILPKLRCIVPEFSIIGMLLLEHPDRLVVRSDASGLMQHDPFSWQIRGRGFVLADALSPASLRIDQLLDDWLEGVGIEERQELVETLFNVLDENQVTTVGQLGSSLLRNTGSIMLALRHMNGATRQKVRQLAGDLMKAAVKRDGREEDDA